MPTEEIVSLKCTCTRCGHIWKARKGKPVRCANCMSPYWDKERSKNIVPNGTVQTKDNIKEFR